MGIYFLDDVKGVRVYKKKCEDDTNQDKILFESINLNSDVIVLLENYNTIDYSFYVYQAYWCSYEANNDVMYMWRPVTKQNIIDYIRLRKTTQTVYCDDI